VQSEGSQSTPNKEAENGAESWEFASSTTSFKSNTQRSDAKPERVEVLREIGSSSSELPMTLQERLELQVAMIVSLVEDRQAEEVVIQNILASLDQILALLQKLQQNIQSWDMQRSDAKPEHVQVNESDSLVQKIKNKENKRKAEVEDEESSPFPVCSDTAKPNKLRRVRRKKEPFGESVISSVSTVGPVLDSSIPPTTDKLPTPPHSPNPSSEHTSSPSPDIFKPLATIMPLREFFDGFQSEIVSFKEANKQDKKNWLRSSTCFVIFRRDYPKPLIVYV
jgi:hypothetical protein